MSAAYPTLLPVYATILRNTPAPIPYLMAAEPQVSVSTVNYKRTAYTTTNGVALNSIYCVTPNRHSDKSTLDGTPTTEHYDRSC